MTILVQPPNPLLPGAQKLDEIAKECNDEENAKEAKTIKNKKKKRTCQKLGQDKHACCEKKIQEHRDANPPDGQPPLQGEQGYKRPTFRNGRAVQPVNTAPTGQNRGQAIQAAIAGCGSGASRKAISSAIGKALGGSVFPDAAIIEPPPNGKTFVDFKFACPASHRSKKKSTQRNYRPPTQSRRQAAAHNALGQATGGGKTITIRW